jgi:hypothetical protein
VRVHADPIGSLVPLVLGAGVHGHRDPALRLPLFDSDASDSARDLAAAGRDAFRESFRVCFREMCSFGGVVYSGGNARCFLGKKGYESMSLPCTEFRLLTSQSRTRLLY